MHIRRALPTDAADLANTFLTAYEEDPLTTWLYPRMSQNLRSMLHVQTLKVKAQLIRPNVRIIMMVSDEEDAEWNGIERVLGCATWRRVGGEGETAKKWGQEETVGKKLDRFLLSWETWYSNLIDRATDWDHVKQFVEATKNFPNYGTTLDSFWHLTGMAVNPNARRRGIATKLVEWGMQLAAEENIPITLESSPLGFEVYKKAGFRTFESCTIDGAGTGHAMLWEPENCAGHWLEVDGEGKPRLKGVES